MQIKNQTDYDTSMLRGLFAEALTKHRRVEDSGIYSKEIAVKVYIQKRTYDTTYTKTRGYAYTHKVRGGGNDFWEGRKYYIKIGLPKPEIADIDKTRVQVVFFHELYHCMGWKSHRKIPSDSNIRTEFE